MILEFTNKSKYVKGANRDIITLDKKPALPAWKSIPKTNLENSKDLIEAQPKG